MLTAGAKKQKVRYFSNIDYPYASTWDKETRKHVTFTLANIHTSIANGIRRAIIGKVQTLGFRNEPHKFSTISIEKNDTGYLNNQIISHRISMIPVNITDIDKFDIDDHLFMLDVSNDTNVVRLVTTEDIKVKRINSNTFLSEKETRAIFPPDKLTGYFIPIAKLKPKYHTNVGGHDAATTNAIGESIKIPVAEPITLRLTAKLVRSNGDENGLFSPVAVSAYGYTIDKERVAAAEQAYVDSQNAETTKYGLTPIPEDKLRRRFKINQIQRVYKVNEAQEPDSFDFRIESIGVFPPLICVERGIRWCIDSVMRLIANLRSGNTKEVNVKPLPHLGNGFEIDVNNEDDTLGNMVHSWLNREYADYSLENRVLESVTYHKAHPLERRVIFTIKPIDEPDYMSVVQGTIIKGCESLVSHLEEILADLMESSQYIAELKAIV